VKENERENKKNAGKNQKLFLLTYECTGNSNSGVASDSSRFGSSDLCKKSIF